MKSAEFSEKRKRLGLTQEQLAHRMGITVRQMVRIEGRENVPIKYAFALMWIEHCANAETA